MMNKAVPLLLFLLVPLTSYSSPSRALIYRGPGACDEECYSAAYDMAWNAGLSPEFVGPRDITKRTSKAKQKSFFDGVAVWIQPGGTAKTAALAMSKELKTQITEFVQNGGGYVGFCAGGFLATEYVGTTNTKGLNLIAGRSIMYTAVTSDAAILLNKWGNTSRYIYWEGGPYFNVPESSGIEVIGYYPNGQISTIRASKGLGKVYVTGLHPEAPQSWRKYYGLQDKDGLDFDYAVEMINWVKAK